MRFTDVAFASRTHPDLPVEVVDLNTMVERVGTAHLVEAQRPDFGLVLLADGPGRHCVDFEVLELEAGSAVVVRPGQVQQWQVDALPSAVLVLARPEFCERAWSLTGPSVVHLDASSQHTVSDLLGVLRREQARFAHSAAASRIVVNCYAALEAVLDVAAAPSASHDRQPDPYLAYRAALEQGPLTQHDVTGYVDTLPYSRRTIDRACRAAVGLSAKQVLDERIALEAKRLLAHSADGLTVIARQLGFGEVTNFNKFFARVTGDRPAAFRASVGANRSAASG